MKHLRKFNESINYEGFYIIGWGLSGGFGGIHNYEVIKADSLEAAEKDAYYRAIDEYESYSGHHGLRSVDDIIDEDDVDSDEAEEIYNEEREGWLDYVAKPYSKEYEKKVKGNHYNNPYKEEIDSIN
jgi:reverse gyrase